jgi:hypothetical protein
MERVQRTLLTALTLSIVPEPGTSAEPFLLHVISFPVPRGRPAPILLERRATGIWFPTVVIRR